MHAKAYIGYTGLESVPGTAIIGSANFSTFGFTGNTELNYLVTHGGRHRRSQGLVRTPLERQRGSQRPSGGATQK